MCSACQGDYEADDTDDTETECPMCHGDGIIQSKPAGAGYEDDLAEYVPCPMWRIIMKTWYRAEFWTGRITPVSCLKESATQVVVMLPFYGDREHRRFKVSSSESFHPTFEEAKAALIGHYQAQVYAVACQLSQANDRLIKAKEISQ